MPSHVQVVSPEGTPRSSTSCGVCRVGPVDEHAGVAAGHEQAHAHRLAAAVGERLGARDGRGDRADRDHARLRRRHVLHDGVGQRDGAPLAAQRDPVAVAAVLHLAPVVVAAVPGERQAAVGLERAAVGEAAHPVAVARDDVDGDVVVLLDREGDAGAVLAPVGVRREERRREDRVHRRRRALEALGGEERPERRDHERGEREPGQERHSRCTDPLATTGMPGGSPSQHAAGLADHAAVADDEDGAAARRRRSPRSPPRPARPAPPATRRRGSGTPASPSAIRRTARARRSRGRRRVRPAQSPTSTSMRRGSSRGCRPSSLPAIVAVSCARSSGLLHSSADARAGELLAQRQRLRAAELVERRITVALEAPRGVVVGLPVAGEEDAVDAHRRAGR